MDIASSSSSDVGPTNSSRKGPDQTGPANSSAKGPNQTGPKPDEFRMVKLYLFGVIALTVVGMIVFYFTYGSFGPIAKALARRAASATSRIKVFLDAGIDAGGDVILEIIAFLQQFAEALGPILESLSNTFATLLRTIGASGVEAIKRFALMIDIATDAIILPIEALFKILMPGIIEGVELAFETIKTLIVNIFNSFNPSKCKSLSNTFT